MACCSRGTYTLGSFIFFSGLQTAVPADQRPPVTMRGALFCAIVALCILADEASAVAGNGGIERRASKSGGSGRSSRRARRSTAGDRDLRGKTATTTAAGQRKRQDEAVHSDDGGSTRRRDSSAVVVGAVWEEEELEVSQLFHVGVVVSAVCDNSSSQRKSSCSRARSIPPAATK